MLLKKSRKSRLEDRIETVMDRARDQASELVERVAPHVEQARDRIADDYLPAASGAVAGVVAGAREAVPVVQDAATEAAHSTARNYRDVVRPAAQQAYAHTRDVKVPAARDAFMEAREKAVPAAQAALLAAQEKAQEKAHEKVDRVRSELPGAKKKSGKGKKLLIGLGVVGLGAAAAKLLQGRQHGRTLPYVPPTPAARTTSAAAAAHPADPASTAGAASAAAATAAAGDEGLATVGGTGSRPDNLAGDVPGGPQEVAADTTDAGGSAPGEALSDEHEGPHPVTTPDAPADSEELDERRD